MDTGLSMALVQKKDITERHVHTAFWTIVFTGFLLTLAGLLVSPLIAWVFHEPRLTLILAALSLTFIIASLGGTHQALMERNLEMKKLAKRALISRLTGSIAGISCALSGLGVWSLVIQQLTDGVMATGLAWKIHHYRPRFQFARNLFKELFSFGIYVVGTRITGFISTRIDDLLIGYYLGTENLGYYSVAYRVITTIQNLVGNLGSSVALPAFSRLQEQKEKLQSVFLSATRFAGFMGFPVFVTLVLFAPEFTYAFLGMNWTPSIVIIQILSFVGLSQTIFRFNGNVIMALGKPDWLLRFRMASALVMFVAFFMAVRWGIVAVALSYVFVTYAFAPFLFWMASRLTQVTLNQYLHQLQPTFLSSVVMGALLALGKYGIHESVYSTPILLLFLFVGVFIYIMSVKWMEPSILVELKSLTTLGFSRPSS